MTERNTLPVKNLRLVGVKRGAEEVKYFGAIVPESIKDPELSGAPLPERFAARGLEVTEVPGEQNSLTWDKDRRLSAGKAGDAEGVPLEGLLFLTARPAFVPLIMAAQSWNAGILLASSVAVETPPAPGRKRFPLGLPAGEDTAAELRRWVEFGKGAGDSVPRLFLVNWFTCSENGRRLWPGGGDNSRVLLWALACAEGKARTRETPAADLPYVKDLDIEEAEIGGGELTHMMLDRLLTVEKPPWKKEAEELAAFYETLGDGVPAVLLEELEALRQNVTPKAHRVMPRKQ